MFWFLRCGVRLMFSRVVLLNFISLFFTISMFMVQPILPVYLYHGLGATEQEVGVILALIALTSAFLRIPCAVCIRSSGVLKATVLGMGLNAAAILGYGLSWNPMIFAFFRVLHGIALALNYTLLLSIASMIAQEGRVEETVTSYTMALAMGLWLGPASGTILNSFLGLRSLMFVASMLGFVGMVLALILANSLRSCWSRKFSEDERPRLSSLIKSENFLLTAVYLSFMFVFGALSAYAPLKARIEFNLRDQLIIFLFTGYFFIVFFMRLLLLKVERFGRRFGKLLAFSLLSGGLGMMIVGLSWNVPLFALGLCWVGIAHGLVFPLTASATARVTPAHLRVLGNSFYLTASDLGNLLGPVAVSIMLGFMPLSQSLMFTAIPPLLGLIVVKLLNRESGSKLL